MTELEDDPIPMPDDETVIRNQLSTRRDAERWEMRYKERTTDKLRAGAENGRHYQKGIFADVTDDGDIP